MEGDTEQEDQEAGAEQRVGNEEAVRLLAGATAEADGEHRAPEKVGQQQKQSGRDGKGTGHKGGLGSSSARGSLVEFTRAGSGSGSGPEAVSDLETGRLLGGGTGDEGNSSSSIGGGNGTCTSDERARGEAGGAGGGWAAGAAAGLGCSGGGGGGGGCGSGPHVPTALLVVVLGVVLSVWHNPGLLRSLRVSRRGSQRRSAVRTSAKGDLACGSRPCRGNRGTYVPGHPWRSARGLVDACAMRTARCA